MHTCGVTSDGGAYCWGDADHGKLGLSDVRSVPTPVHVGSEHVFTLVEAAGETTCAVTADGQALCWGWMRDCGGGMCLTKLGQPIEPRENADELRFVALTGLGFHFCGLTKEGTAYCWGDNHTGALGAGRSVWKLFKKKSASSAPLAVAGDEKFLQLSAGFSHTCGVTIEGQVRCWGLDDAKARPLLTPIESEPRR
jgi:alpha-tubulin suppressor-like RCC1 family protein